MKSSFYENRLAQLIHIFQKAQPMTVAALASKLDVSERTIRNDIKQLNEVLQPHASIEGVRGNYTLRIFDMTQFRKTIERLYSANDVLNCVTNRMEYIFEKLLQAQEPVLMDELAYEMNIARTTFVGDLKKLRAELEQYDISVVGKQNRGLLLCGCEMDIRKYVLENLYDALYGQYPLDVEIVQMVTEAFAESSWGKSVQQSFLMFLTLMLDRYLQEHAIGKLSVQFYNLTERPEFAFVDTLLQRIEQFLHITFPIEERIFVFLPIIGMRTPSDLQVMQCILLDNSVHGLMARVLECIKAEMNITIESGEFTEEFLYHLMFMVNRLRFHVRLRNPMVEELQKKYPLAYRMANIAANVVQEEYNCMVSEDEKGYLASYFSVFLEENSRKYKKVFHVAVVCGTGRVTARLIAAQLRKVLDSSAELTLFPYDTITSEILNAYDIVLTTIDLHCSCKRPVIRIYEIFQEQELIHKIEKARYWDQIEVPVLDNNWFVMASLLDQSRFFRLDAYTSYEQGVAYMVDCLTESGQLDKAFKERLQRREEKGSMVFDTIAIPHTVQYASDKLVLAIGVFQEPIVHQQHHVRVIFLLALPEQSKQEELLIRVYDEIMHITQDTTLLEKIANAKDFQALLHALYLQVGR